MWKMRGNKKPYGFLAVAFMAAEGAAKGYLPSFGSQLYLNNSTADWKSFIEIRCGFHTDMLYCTKDYYIFGKEVWHVRKSNASHRD